MADYYVSFTLGGRGYVQPATTWEDALVRLGRLLERGDGYGHLALDLRRRRAVVDTVPFSFLLPQYFHPRLVALLDNLGWRPEDLDIRTVDGQRVVLGRTHAGHLVVQTPLVGGTRPVT